MSPKEELRRMLNQFAYSTLISLLAGCASEDAQRMTDNNLTDAARFFQQTADALNRIVIDPNKKND